MNQDKLRKWGIIGLVLLAFAAVAYVFSRKRRA